MDNHYFQEITLQDKNLNRPKNETVELNIDKQNVVNQTNWYLSKNGEKAGPYSEGDMKLVIESGLIGFGNKVYQEGDSDWVPIEDTVLKQYINSAPPLVGEDINNSTAWWVAFAPIISTIIFFLLISFTISNRLYEFSEMIYDWNFVIYIVVNLVFITRDVNSLRRAGHDVSQFGNFFLIPVYLWKRNKLLSQTQATFGFWLFFTFFDFIIISTAF